MSKKSRKKSLAVLVSGGGSNLQSIIDACESGEINGNITAVIASNDSAYALTRAKNYNIPSYVCALKDFPSPALRDEKIIEILKADKTDYVILAGYLGILSPRLINEFKNKIVNIHPSLLPAYGGDKCHGINVHRMVIQAKEKFSGATVHFVDEGVDTGLIIRQKSIAVLQSDTPESLQERILNTVEHDLLTQVIKDLCDDKITVQNGKVVFEKTNEY